MADSLPNMDLSQQNLRRLIQEQRLAIERAKEAVLELVDRRQRNLVNREAALRAIADMEAQAPADLMEKQRLKAQLASQRYTIERQELENMEGAMRIVGQKEIIEAAEKSLVSFAEKLKGIEAAHGQLSDERFNRLMAEAIT